MFEVLYFNSLPLNLLKLKRYNMLKNALKNYAAKFCAVSFMAINTGLVAQIQLDHYYVNNSSAAIGTYQGINFREGGFSGLYSIPGTNGKEFYTLSDRGVNVDAKNATCTPTYDKIYGFPSYAPKIHRIKITGDSIQILETFTVKRPNGTGATGVLNPTGFGSTASEEAWSDTVSNCLTKASKYVTKDAWGIDCEGIVIGKDNDFWVCEEGGATVWNLNANGKVIKRYSPYANLVGAEAEDLAIDTVFKFRKNNRGFEGVAITPSGKIYALIQSAILFPDKATGEASLVHRLLEIDPITKATKMYAYLNPGDYSVGPDKIKAKDWKIGDLVAINDTSFLVIEQGVSAANIVRKVFKIGISTATPVSSGLYGGKTLEALKNAAGLAGASIVPVTKTLFMDMRINSLWPDSLEKAEGLAIINDSTLAICNDNDFGQASPLENGIASAINIKSMLFVYNLKGSNKVPHYMASNQVITAVNSLNKDENHFSIYPNPSSGEVFFNKTVSVEVYNILGSVVSAHVNATSINVGALSKGVYILKTSENEVLRLVVE